MKETAPFRILTVWTGCIRLLQSGFSSGSPGGFEVRSAGTGALVRHPIEPHVAGFVNIFGDDRSGFVFRQLAPQILQGQDLVQALTRDHRSKVIELTRGLLGRAFTLRELARLLPDVEGSSTLPAEELLAWEHQYR